MHLQRTSTFFIIPAGIFLLLCTYVKTDSNGGAPTDKVPLHYTADISHGLPDVMVFVGRLFEYSLKSHEIFGKDGVNLKIHEVDKQDLPEWIQYNASNHALFGLPSSHDTGDTYIEVTVICEEGADQCKPVSDVFKFIVKYASLSHVGSSTPLLANAQSATLTDVKKDGTKISFPSLSLVEEHGCGDAVVLANLVLCVPIESLDVKNKMSMLYNMADFLSIDVWKLTLMPSTGQKLRAVERGYQILSAGPGPNSVCDLDRNVELSWKLSCSAVKLLKDFVKVLEHNLNSGRIEKEVGQPVVGWYVASSDSLETAKKRRKRQLPYRTPIPTPVLQPVTPTVVAETVRAKPEISSTPMFGERSEYVPQVMTRQPVIIEDHSPTLVPSRHPEQAGPSLWTVTVEEITPSSYPTSSMHLHSTQTHTKLEMESVDTSGDSVVTSGDSVVIESSYTRVVPTTSSESLRVTDQYVPDVFETSFSGSGSGSGSPLVEAWTSVIETSPITRPYDVPEYSSSTLEVLEMTPVIDVSQSALPSPEGLPVPVVPTSTIIGVMPESTADLLGRSTLSSPKYLSATPVAPVMTDGSVAPIMTDESVTPIMTYASVTPDQDFLMSERTESTPIYLHTEDPTLVTSEYIFMVPDKLMTSSPEFETSSRLLVQSFPSEVFLSSRSELMASVASGQDDFYSSYIFSMSSAVFIPMGSGSGSGSGSGDGIIKESVTPSRVYQSHTLPTVTDTIEISGSGQMGSGENITHPVDPTTPPMTEINHPPSVVIPVSEYLIVPLGLFWEFAIPNEVFFDEEDGDVTNLEMSLTFIDGRRLPPEYWLQVDKNRRTLNGLLTTSDLTALKHLQVLLVATDSGGLSANTVINLALETPEFIKQTHKVDIAFAVDYDEFMNNKKVNLERFLGKISSFYGDQNSNDIRITDIRRGSLIVSWNNASLNGQDCEHEKIEMMFNKMKNGETLQSNFIKHMQPEFHPLFVEYEFMGACGSYESGSAAAVDYEPVTPATRVPVYVDNPDIIYPSSAVGEGSTPESADRIHSGSGSGFHTEMVDMHGVTERIDTGSAHGSGGLWTPAYKPSVSPSSSSAVTSSSFFIMKFPDNDETTTESSTYSETSTSTTTDVITTTSGFMMTGDDKKEMTSSPQDKTLPWVSVESWTFPVRSTEAFDRAPFLENPIDYIPANLGKYFEYAIPRGVFYDREDGDTRSLQLSLTLLSGQIIPKNFWLQLDTERQMITGLPLLVDLDVGYHRIILKATDSSGQSVKDAIKLYVNSSSFVRFTHKFIMVFKLDFASFMNDRTNLNKLLQKIGSYFGDTSTDNMVLMDVSMGSLVLSWSNMTLNGDICHNKTINKLYRRMVRKGEMVRPAFNRHLSPDYDLQDVKYELQGACVYQPTTTYIPTTEASTSGSGLSVWAQVVLPVMIALLVLLLILLIVLLINRKRRRQSTLQNSEKPVFTNDRNPIIFPEEMEGDDMGLKPKKPMVLPNDRNNSASPSPRTTYYFEDEPQSDHGSNYGTGSRSGTGRRHPKSPPPYYQPHSDPPPYRLPPPYLNNSSDV